MFFNPQDNDLRNYLQFKHFGGLIFNVLHLFDTFGN